VAEATVALAAVAILGVVIAQCTVWGVRERARLAARQAALELAANVLEAARATPWDRLDQDWAAAQVVPSEMADLLPEGKVVATVEPEKLSPHARRVTVEVRWRSDPTLDPYSVQLTTVLSARAEKAKAGDKP
jgi:hypothetical protein